MNWVAPSRAEDATGAAVIAEEANVLIPVDDDLAGDNVGRAVVQGGQERGLIIHKLFEEILTGELVDEPRALMQRADTLVRDLGHQPMNDPSRGLCPSEIAACINRGLRLPQIAAVRELLVPEFPVCASARVGSVETITSGIADAIAIGEEGPELVVDWKSDIAPNAEAAAQYQAQVRSYLEVTKIPRGVIVFVTTGEVVEVRLRSGPQTPGTAVVDQLDQIGGVAWFR